MQRSTSTPSLLLFLALAAMVFGAGYLFLRSPAKKRPETAEVAANDAAQTAPAEDSVAQELSAAQHAQAPKPPAVVTPIARPAPAAGVAAAPQPPRVEPSPYTRQLVAGLTGLDVTRGPITKE